uniref:Uncharacterized protein n=1 Tax=Helianthus annuus TaxID=4232 RepID=A0A251VBV0_HELAN
MFEKSGEILSEFIQFTENDTFVIIYSIKSDYNVSMSTNYPQYLSLDPLAHSSNGVCDYGHITPWLTRCPMVKIIK